MKRRVLNNLINRNDFIGGIFRRMYSVSYKLSSIACTLKGFKCEKGLEDIISTGLCPRNKKRIKFEKKSIVRCKLPYADHETEIYDAMEAFNTAYMTARKIMTTKSEAKYLKQLCKLYSRALCKTIELSLEKTGGTK